MRLAVWVFPAFAFATTASSSLAAPPPCNSFTLQASASLSSDPGREGLYKYTLSGRWDAGRRDLVHMNLVISLDACACACNSGIIRFEPVAGRSSGHEPGRFDPCSAEFAGSTSCQGFVEPAGAVTGAAVMFSPVDSSGCDPGLVGSGSWSFYSPLPPVASNTAQGAIVFRRGGEICVGSVTGQLPGCTCSTLTNVQSWGRTKTIYR